MIEKLERRNYNNYHISRKLNEIIDVLNEREANEKGSGGASGVSADTSGGTTDVQDHRDGGNPVLVTDVEFEVNNPSGQHSKGETHGDVPVPKADGQQLQPDKSGV